MRVDSVRQDVGYAMRSFRRSPGFTLVALLVLGLGIAANTTIFSVVNAVLLRPLQVTDPERLRFLSVVFKQSSNMRHGVPYLSFEQLAPRRDVFSGVAGFVSDAAKLGNGAAANRVVGERVTTGYFDVLGVRPALGRTFVPADDLSGADPVIVISDRFWRTKLDGNPNVLGATIDLRSPFTYSGTYLRYHRVYTIVGIMPPRFKGISTVWVPSDYWVPLRQRASDLEEAQAELSGRSDAAPVADRMELWTRATLVARPLAASSNTAIRAAVSAVKRAMPDTQFVTRQGLRTDRGVIVIDRSIEGRLPFDSTGKLVPERFAVALMMVPLMVVLIAGANLAGILMARGVARRGEIGVRLALGAGRARVARQIITESLLLSAGGAAIAILLSRGFLKVFTNYMPRLGGIGVFNLSAVSLDVPLDVRVVLFTLALGVGSGILVGMTPAIQALRTDILTALAGGGNSLAASPRSRLHRWVVVPQITLSVVLLLAAGVLVRTLLRSELADRGFDATGVVYTDVAQPPRYFANMTPDQRRAQNARQKAEYLQLLEQVRSLPGIDAAALVNKVIWTDQDSVPVFSRKSYRDGQTRWAAAAHVSHGYFEAMRIPITRGRPFSAHDNAASTPVAIVDERLAQMLWPDEDAVGKDIASPDPGTNAAPTWLRIVGITNRITLPGDEERRRPLIFLPIEQRPEVLVASVLARGRANAPDLLKTLPAAIVAARPDAEVPRTRTITDDIGEAMYPVRLGTTVLALSGVFGLLLSAVGLYGVVSYSAAQRMREIGIRTALGAARRDLFALLLRDALVALAVALSAGMALGVAAVRIVSSVVIALPRPDLVTSLTVPLVLSTVILAACLRPVRRAARANPIDVLRQQ